MSITLLNFETHFRAEKVNKSRQMFLNGHVIELNKAKIVWVGKLRIGSYKVQVDLEGITVEDASCTCDSRSKSGYCEHKLAVFFALRKELDLYPALTNSSVKLLPTDTNLKTLLDEINYSVDAPHRKDIELFTRLANAMLKGAEKNIKSGKLRPALGDCFEVIKQAADMNLVLQHGYNDEDSLTEKAFELLGLGLEKITDNEIRDHLAYDLRIEALRTFRSDDDLWEKWMELLAVVSDEGVRHDKFKNVLDTFEKIKQNFPEKQY